MQALKALPAALEEPPPPPLLDGLLLQAAAMVAIAATAIVTVNALRKRVSFDPLGVNAPVAGRRRTVA
jgi:hypothetical protein